jgi:hypothetical protein
VLRSGKENNWQSITKECQRFLTGKQAKKKKNTTKATKQWKQDDSHAEYYSMAEIQGFKNYNNSDDILNKSTITT